MCLLLDLVTLEEELGKQLRDQQSKSFVLPKVSLTGYFPRHGREFWSWNPLTTPKKVRYKKTDSPLLMPQFQGTNLRPICSVVFAILLSLPLSRCCKLSFLRTESSTGNYLRFLEEASQREHMCTSWVCMGYGWVKAVLPLSCMTWSTQF